MASPAGSWIRLVICAVLVGGCIIVNWRMSDRPDPKAPVLRAVATRALAAGRELTAADVEIELAWASATEKRIGRADKIVGLSLKNALAAGAPIAWADLEPAKKAAPAAGVR